MSTKRITTLIAEGSAVAAALAFLTVAPASAGPDSATCVDAWNNESNSAGQLTLADWFADGAAGNVIVGSDKGGDCVLAAYNTNKPMYVLYRQSGDAFDKAGGGPRDQYTQYRATIDYLDVILQPSGKVEPVSQ